jgi:hypothetical protein
VYKFVSLFACALLSLSFYANADEFNPEQFAKDYFSAWAATQSPTATEKDLEHYLSFLADDVGHQHLPYDTDDSRQADGKESMREGIDDKEIQLKYKFVVTGLLKMNPKKLV